MLNPGLRPYSFILTACVWFSAMGLLTHEVNREGGHWLVVAGFRSGIATLLAFLAAKSLGIPLVFFRPRMLWIRSLAGSCSMLATFYALGHMLVSDVLTITNTFPIWVALLSWPLAGERPTRGVWIAVVCSVAGIAFAEIPKAEWVAMYQSLPASVTGAPIAGQPDSEKFRWEPALAALAASFFTAVAMLGINRLKGVAPLAVVVHFSAVSTMAVFIVLACSTMARPQDERFGQLDRLAVLGMLLAVGLTAVLGQFFLTRAYAIGSPTKVSVVALSQVLFVMAVEALLGRKAITWNVVLGTALVLGPVAWLMTRERRPPKTMDETKLEEVAIE